MDRVGADQSGRVIVRTIERSHRQNAQGMLATGPIRRGNVRRDRSWRSSTRDAVPVWSMTSSTRSTRPGGLSGNDLISTFTSQSSSSGQAECLGERGDASPGRNGSVPPTPAQAGRACRTHARSVAAIGGDEPGAGVEGPNLAEIEVGNAKPASARGSSLNRVATSVVRSSDSSCKTIGTPSRVN